jgi:hypothetical protein
MRPDNSATKRPTLIGLNGGESTSEDLYFWIGASGLQRDYNILTFDGPMETATRLQNPGWVAANFPRSEVINSYRAVVDYALSRPEVDPERIAAMGFSGGGIRVLMMAASDPRIKACIGDAPLPDPATLLEADVPKALQKSPKAVGKLLVKIASAASRSSRIAMERICYVTGDSSPLELIHTIGQYGTDPQEIKCAFLALVEKVNRLKRYGRQSIPMTMYRLPQKLTGYFPVKKALMRTASSITSA